MIYQNKTSPKISPGVNFGVKIYISPGLLSRKHGMLNCSYSIWQDINATSFCSCKLPWRNDECILLPCFHAQPDILQLWTAVSSHWVYFPPISQLGVLIVYIQCNYTWDWGMHVVEYAYYVSKLRQNVGLETWIWRQIVTPQTMRNKYKWHHMPLNEPQYAYSAKTKGLIFTERA